MKLSNFAKDKILVGSMLLRMMRLLLGFLTHFINQVLILSVQQKLPVKSNGIKLGQETL